MLAISARGFRTSSSDFIAKARWLFNPRAYSLPAFSVLQNKHFIYRPTCSQLVKTSPFSASVRPCHQSSRCAAFTVTWIVAPATGASPFVFFAAAPFALLRGLRFTRRHDALRRSGSRARPPRFFLGLRFVAALVLPPLARWLAATALAKFLIHHVLLFLLHFLGLDLHRAARDVRFLRARELRLRHRHASPSRQYTQRLPPSAARQLLWPSDTHSLQ
jgi:uncharacterized membrane protein YqaE (UPF0057 family)